jgi:hypothetical protein
VRTTLSIDDDVAGLLSEEMRRSGSSLKKAVNHYLRQGLMASKQQTRRRFVVAPRPMGLPAGLSYDNIGELIQNLEGLAHK